MKPIAFIIAASLFLAGCATPTTKVEAPILCEIQKTADVATKLIDGEFQLLLKGTSAGSGVMTVWHAPNGEYVVLLSMNSTASVCVADFGFRLAATPKPNNGRGA